MSLSRQECMDLSMRGAAGAGLFHPGARKDFNWLTENQNLAEVIKKGDGAGDIRQAGRFLLFDKVEELEDRIHNMIDSAKVNLTSPRIVIHIFAGVSGGTGSGLFLDVCYRKTVQRSTRKWIDRFKQFRFIF